MALDTDRESLKAALRELLLEALAESATDQKVARVGPPPRDLDELRERAIDVREASKSGPAPSSDAESQVVSSVIERNPLGSMFRLLPDTIDGTEWLSLELVIEQLPAAERQMVILDFAEVKKVASVGIGRLIVLHDALLHSGDSLVLINVAKQVEIVLEMMGVESLLATCKDLPTLIGRLAKA